MHTLNQAVEERLASEILVCVKSVSCSFSVEYVDLARTVLLEVLLGGGDELDGGKLEAEGPQSQFKGPV